MVPQILLGATYGESSDATGRAALASGVDERAYPLGLTQLVVEPDRLLGLPDVRGDVPVLQHPEGIPGDAEPLVEAPREHHRGGAALQQLLDVGALDARLVFCTGLVPEIGRAHV